MITTRQHHARRVDHRGKTIQLGVEGHRQESREPHSRDEAQRDTDRIQKITLAREDATHLHGGVAQHPQRADLASSFAERDDRRVEHTPERDETGEEDHEHELVPHRLAEGLVDHRERPVSFPEPDDGRSVLEFGHHR